jgi:hypothetical protein
MGTRLRKLVVLVLAVGMAACTSPSGGTGSGGSLPPNSVIGGGSHE